MASTILYFNLEKEEILNNFCLRSNEILDFDFIEEKYIDFAKSTVDNYLWIISGKTRRFWFRVINKLSGYKFASWYIQNRYSKSKMLEIQNIIKCEAHRETIVNGLSNKRG